MLGHSARRFEVRQSKKALDIYINHSRRLGGHPEV
jgi:hypothetical protein